MGGWQATGIKVFFARSCLGKVPGNKATGIKVDVRLAKRGNGSAKSVGKGAEGEVATRALAKDWTISAGSLGC